MRNRLIAALVIASSSFAFAAVPILAEAAPQRVLVCKNVKKKATNGAVIGALGGGLLGNTVAGRGDRTEGTIIGAGVGAVAGHQIAKSNCRHRR